ncbi:hypothetical protein NHQ30_008499 [Ciborinia camelliae]|nr:hypothetical protein NHQ30_008499 [Ciborinia camelliae]
MIQAGATKPKPYICTNYPTGFLEIYHCHELLSQAVVDKVLSSNLFFEIACDQLFRSTVSEEYFLKRTLSCWNISCDSSQLLGPLPLYIEETSRHLKMEYTPELGVVRKELNGIGGNYAPENSHISSQNHLTGLTPSPYEQLNGQNSSGFQDDSDLWGSFYMEDNNHQENIPYDLSDESLFANDPKRPKDYVDPPVAKRRKFNSVPTTDSSSSASPTQENSSPITESLDVFSQQVMPTQKTAEPTPSSNTTLKVTSETTQQVIGQNSPLSQVLTHGLNTSSNNDLPITPFINPISLLNNFSQSPTNTIITPEIFQTPSATHLLSIPESRQIVQQQPCGVTGVPLGPTISSTYGHPHSPQQQRNERRQFSDFIPEKNVGFEPFRRSRNKQSMFVPRGSVQATQQPMSVLRGPVQASQQPMSIPRGSVQANQQPIAVPQGSVQASQQPMFVPRGSVQATQQPMSIPRGSVQANQQPIAVPQGSVQASQQPTDHAPRLHLPSRPTSNATLQQFSPQTLDRNFIRPELRETMEKLEAKLRIDAGLRQAFNTVFPARSIEVEQLKQMITNERHQALVRENALKKEIREFQENAMTQDILQSKAMDVYTQLRATPKSDRSWVCLNNDKNGVICKHIQKEFYVSGKMWKRRERCSKCHTKCVEKNRKYFDNDAAISAWTFQNNTAAMTNTPQTLNCTRDMVDNTAETPLYFADTPSRQSPPDIPVASQGLQQDESSKWDSFPPLNKKKSRNSAPLSISKSTQEALRIAIGTPTKPWMQEPKTTKPWMQEPKKKPEIIVLDDDSDEEVEMTPSQESSDNSPAVQQETNFEDAVEVGSDANFDADFNAEFDAVEVGSDANFDADFNAEFDAVEVGSDANFDADFNAEFDAVEVGSDANFDADFNSDFGLEADLAAALNAELA